MTHAVIYARISEDRTGAGMGVDRQEKECRELAAREGWEISDVYADNDISAFSGKKRPEYTRLIENIRSGGVMRVIAWHTDRIHRTPRELEDYIDASEVHGAITHTVKAGLVDLSTAGGRAMARTLCAWARYESDIKRERLRTWSRQQYEAGMHHGGRRPFGWKADRKTRDPEEAAEVRAWAVHVLAGGSLGELVRDLDERGVKPVSAKRWSRMAVRTVLLSPRVAGWRTHDGIVTAKGQWEPILSDEVHRQVVAIITQPDRYQLRGNGHARVNLLVGQARCDHCDAPLTTRAVSRRGRGLKRCYHCAGCGMYRTMEPVDEYVEEYAKEQLRQGGEPPESPEVPVEGSRVEFLQAKIATTKTLFAGDDTVTPGDLLDILRDLRAELAAEQARLAPSLEFRQRQVLDQADPDEFAGYSVARKRAIIDALCEVRLRRTPVGVRRFDPESVVLVRR